MEDIESGVSLEGIKDIAASVWKAIKDAIAKLVAKMKEFWRNLTSAVPGLKKAAAKLQKRAEEAISKSTEETKFELGREVNALAIDYEAPKSGQDIENGLNDFLSLSEAFLDKYSKSLGKVGAEMKKTIESVDPMETSTVDEGLTSMVAAAEKAETTELNKLIKTEVKGDARFANTKGTRGENLMGNVAMFYYGEPSKGAESTLEKAEVARRMKYEVKQSRAKAKDALTEGTMSIITPETAITIADTITRICEVLEEFEGKKVFDSIDKARKDLEGATDKLDANLKKALKEDNFDRNNRPKVNSIIGFNKAFTQWATVPQSQLSSQAVSACRAAIAACNRSLSNYK
jgi:hypothetical protein